MPGPRAVHTIMAGFGVYVVDLHQTTGGKLMRLLCACCAIMLLAPSLHAEARELGIGAMLVGKQMLEVSEVRQMSLKTDGKVESVSISPDGKYVTYLVRSKTGIDLRLAKVSTGKTVTLLTQPTDKDTIRDNPPLLGVIWMLECPEAGALQSWLKPDKFRASWSPDSKSFAVVALRIEHAKGPASEWPVYALLYSATGTPKASLRLPDSCEVIEGPLFTLDSRRLVVNLALTSRVANDEITETKPTIESIDIATGASRDIYASTTSQPNLVGWSTDGSLLFVVYAKGGAELHKIALNGGSDEVLVSECGAAGQTSPDGTLTIPPGKGLTVTNQTTGARVELTTDGPVLFPAWAPNGRMILYWQTESITASGIQARRRAFSSLWLSGIAPGRLSQMCVALDAGEASCSRDCSRIAYTSQDQLYVAELTLRDPTVSEKIVAGLPLDEDEMKQALLTNGKQIGMAMRMYADDWDGKLPPSNDIDAALGPYLSDKGLLKRPGSSDPAFRYIDPGVANESEIKYSASTVLGELDGGYDWIVEIYADGHVKVKPKQ